MFKNINLFFILLSFGMIITISTSCTNEDDNGCENTEDISYQTDVVPILSANCYACHNASSGGMDFAEYGTVKSIADAGYLSGAINHTAGYTAMPLSGDKLSECDIQTIDIWIEEGAQNN